MLIVYNVENSLEPKNYGDIQIYLRNFFMRPFAKLLSHLVRTATAIAALSCEPALKRPRLSSSAFRAVVSF